MIIETVVGCLAETYRLLRPESILHVDELMKERRTNEGLRHRCLYTPDGEIYFMNGKTPTLAITRRSSNPLFQDSTIDEYCQQLLKNKNYRPTSEETQRALHAPDTVVVDLTKLRLQKGDEEFSYLAIDTKNYKRLNSEEKKLAKRVHGQGKYFGLTMKMLANARIIGTDAGVIETRVYVLNLDYVRLHVKENSLGRASWLGDFYGNSHFNVSARGMDDHLALRGVRREVRS